jgi:hypothetical protein
LAEYRAGDLERWAKKVNQRIDRVITASVFDISSKIIKRTPVDTGRLRGNWQATIGSAALGALFRTSDPTSEVQILCAQAPGNIYWMVNNLPYATVAEYGLWGSGAGATDKTTREGFSIQSPYGMVRVTVSEFSSALRKALASE